jgi:hypothetical protein
MFTHVGDEPILSVTTALCLPPSGLHLVVGSRANAEHRKRRRTTSARIRVLAREGGGAGRRDHPVTEADCHNMAERHRGPVR